MTLYGENISCWRSILGRLALRLLGLLAGSSEGGVDTSAILGLEMEMTFVIVRI